MIAPGTKLRARAKTAGNRHSPPIWGLVPLVIGLVAWQLLAVGGNPYFPPPSEWWRALVELWQAGRLQPAFGSTLLSFIFALAIATCLGAALGILVGRSARADRLLGPSFEFARTMPAGALVPVAVLLIGYTPYMTLGVVVATSIWPVLLSTRASSKQLSKERLEAARVMKLSRADTFRKVILPSVTPGILLGVQISAPLALIITLVVEVITQVSGIGKEIGLAQGNFQSAAVYGLVAVTGVLGLLVNIGVGNMARITRRFQA